MRLLTYKSINGFQLGIKTPQGVIDVQSAAQHFALSEVPNSIEAYYRIGIPALAAIRILEQEVQKNRMPTLLMSEEELVLGPAVTTPGKIICIGLNYRQHAIESGAAIPATPVLFSKFNNALAATGEQIRLPDIAQEYDYEAELAVVIGARAQNVNSASALDYVLGYCCANDLSARDLQLRTSQWLLGKTLDHFLPIGPYLVTADEVPEPQNLHVKCWLNGELRQNKNTSDMIFSVAEIIAYVSRHFTLEPGDIICTGTPEGVIFGMPEKCWLKQGDTVVVEVEGLGRLTNTFWD